MRAVLLPAACIAALGTPAMAQTITAEQAMDNYRRTFVPVAELDCPESTDEEEIVVCGRSGKLDPYRAPLPVPRTPGLPFRGEPPSGMDALSGADACLFGCRQPLRLDLVKAAKVGRKIIRQIFDPD